ncbi:MAG: protein kinase, partial [Gemmatimonadota bacterium]
DAIAGDRFLQEIEIAARLNHPHIVPLFDSGEQDGILYFVMPFEEGESLRDRLDREGQLPLTEAVRIAREVAEALAYAHGQGVIHRDVKPGNILLSGGHAIVTDFGVARAVSSSAKKKFTAPGLALGTPAYMSPEQAEGREDLDPRSDLYSLGCVLYEMLGGEPPFSGQTPRSVIARQIGEAPLPISSLRTTVPPSLERIVQKALAKAPADRFRSGADLVQALDAPNLLQEDEGATRIPVGRYAALAIALGTVVIAGILGVRAWIDSQSPPLDPNKILILPLGDRGGGGMSGADAAIWIVSTLEHAEPLRPIDAWDRLNPSERMNIDLLPPGSARSIAEASGAAHFMTGAITRLGDSLGISLVLHATEPDTVVGRESAFGPASEEAVSQLGLRATVDLLPLVIDPERDVDLSAITDRRPAAIVHWIHGERAYRLSRFEEALASYERTIAEDSLFAFAALKGGQAAAWIKDDERARSLLDVALRHSHLLPVRHQHFASGLSHFTDSEADSAVHYFRMALEEKEDWSEAWMALGEVYHHLFPRDLVVDSSDEAAFRRSHELDRGFHPPLIHLTEDALRRGRTDEASEYLEQLSAGGANPSTLLRLDLTLQCVDEGPDRPDWGEAAATDPLALLGAGLSSAVGGHRPACAKAAFRALLRDPTVPQNIASGAIQGLQGLLVAGERYEEALSLLDSAIANRFGSAQLFLILDVLASAPWEDRATELENTVRTRFGDAYEGMNPNGLWVLGSWHAYKLDLPMLIAARDGLRSRADEGFEPAERTWKALDAQVALLSGDTLGAIEQLGAVLPNASRTDLAWELSASLPVRHLRLAELLLAKERYADALATASLFDHAEPVVFFPFLRQSLQIRIAAARALGHTSAVESYERRLEGLRGN